MKTVSMVWAALLLGGVVVGCGSSSDSGTTGHAITLKTRAEVQGEPAQPTTNALGWSVALSKAYLSVGPLYYYRGDPVLSRRELRSHEKRNALAWFAGLVVPSAYAHPGHYIEGAAMGQMLTPTTLNLLGGTVNLADGQGVTGDTNSAKFTWQSPPMGDQAPALEGHMVLTEGVATKDTVSLRFIAKADEPDVRDGDNLPKVGGCAFGSEPGKDGVSMDADGTVTLTLVPSVWFDQVDFGYVAPGAAGALTPDRNGVVDIAGTLAWQGFIRGVKKGTAYLFSYRK
jgi:hypothetical protein